jgi:6-phosphogluconolactonase
MTLTYPAINRARQILWLVIGEDKAAILTRLRRADPTIPAGRVSQDQAVMMTNSRTFAGD